MDSIIVRITVFCLFFSLARGWLFSRMSNEVCYGKLGCFSKEYPFTNAKGMLPRPPKVIGTKFLLFTRNSTQEYEELVLTDRQKKCAWKSLCKLKQIKVIIHGYMDSVEKQWVKDMVGALLKHDDYNVIFVDWRKGAWEINYLRAVANTRVVGAQVAQLLKVLRKVYDIDPVNVHIIGHSLGAHTAGYVGEHMENIGRITGLDPAGPSFEKTDPRVRLDRTDALFVDVIHTDAEHLFSLGFGLKQQIGTVDFYPNGGKDQPGCPTTYFAQMSLLFSGNFQFVNNFACSHLRALEFFTESINSECQFNAYPCEIINNKASNQCKSCKTGCGIMGLHTNTSMIPGIYFLETNSSEPYCKK
ncbi:inactive pancreatic lipase-related protein 1-like isoform X2 [Mercenaria mercenaria]|uniref:inactive pancreatic lipase-related protein 1-like isoform X2 n=1 Tax=Mercenaria mercenaria TaxID=6596 RepID=UPI00234E7356|nr:inactive pancreatic lipase-related protein 1-like isoform X2 [Mercenaria mercenaria]